MGYEGKLVRLVPLEKERHFENLLRWINSPEITQWLLAGSFPMTRGAEEEWFAWSQKSTTDIHFAIERISDGKHLGVSGIHDINHLHGTAVTGSYIGELDEQGKGYGSDAALVRARYCFDVLNLRMLMSGYLEGNGRSKSMSMKLGFVEYGFLPNRYWKNGRYLGEHLIYLTRETFENRHPK